MKIIYIYIMLTFLFTVTSLLAMEEDEEKRSEIVKIKEENNPEASELSDNIDGDSLHESVRQHILCYWKNNGFMIMPDCEGESNDILKNNLCIIIDNIIMNHRSDALNILSIGAENGCVNTLRLMIESGLKLYSDEFLIIAPASRNRHNQFCKMLIEWGIFNRTENPELLCAIFLHEHDKVIELINDGLDEAYLADGSNELMMAIAINDIPILELFLQIWTPEAINYRTLIGETALMIAAWCGFKQEVKLLLDNGANPNIQDNNGKTALMDAARNGKKGVVKCLLKGGATVDIVDSNDRTALMEAAHKNHVSILRLLLKKGANPKLKDKYGDTALTFAQRCNNSETIEFLETYVQEK